MNADKKKAIQSLKTARGQIDGIIKMIEEERYCIDISNQISAPQSLLKKANMLILKQHLQNCVKNACNTSEADTDEKMTELINVLEKIMK